MTSHTLKLNDWELLAIENAIAKEIDGAAVGTHYFASLADLKVKINRAASVRDRASAYTYDDRQRHLAAKLETAGVDLGWNTERQWPHRSNT